MIGPRALADAGAVRRLGRVLRVRAVPVPQGREPDGRATPARRASSRRASKSPSRHRSGAAGVLRDSGVGEARQAISRPRTKRSSCASSASSSRGTSTIPAPDGKFGRTDIKLVSADNPLGLDRTDPDAKDDITTINQLNLPVDRPVLVHLSSKDVIHSFGLYEMRVKQDAIPGPRHPGLVHPDRDDREMRAELARPTSTTRSPARSCAASATSGCAASSSCRAMRTTRRGWPIRSKPSRNNRLM